MTQLSATLDFSGLDQFKASHLLNASKLGEPGAPQRVLLALIDFDPAQPRKHIDTEALNALARSIEVHGVLEPVSLRVHPSDAGRFIVNRGERRVRAARLARCTDIPAFVDARVDPYAQVVENEQREALTLFELASFVCAREAQGERRSEIARKLAKPKSLITELASLALAGEGVRVACEAGRIRDARTLYQLVRHQATHPERIEALMQQQENIGRTHLAALETPPPPSMALNAQEREAAGESDDPAKASPITTTQRVRVGASHRGSSAPSSVFPYRLRAEYLGRVGVLCVSAGLPNDAAEIVCEDGTRVQVLLSKITLLTWTAEG